MLIKKLNEKTALEFVRHKDCNILSSMIEEETGKRISASTLKRVTGLVKTDSNPSRHTLHILCRFLGYESIDSFKESLTGSTST